MQMLNSHLTCRHYTCGFIVFSYNNMNYRKLYIRKKEKEKNFK